MKDIYLKFEGATELQGDSTDTKHANEIEVSSFSHALSQPKSSSASSAGGHTAERTEHGEIIMVKDIDKATPKLSEIPGRPGAYRAVSFVRPHFQLDELSVSLRLVAELPGSQQG